VERNLVVLVDIWIYLGNSVQDRAIITVSNLLRKEEEAVADPGFPNRGPRTRRLRRRGGWGLGRGLCPPQKIF